MVVTCFSGRVAQTTWDAARGSGEDVDDGDEEEEVCDDVEDEVGDLRFPLIWSVRHCVTFKNQVSNALR